jgi:hypothetical protein
MSLFEQPSSEPATPTVSPCYDIFTIPRSEKAISRLLLMSYFPSGFWSRLITRILADDQVSDAIRCLYPVKKEVSIVIFQMMFMLITHIQTLFQDFIRPRPESSAQHSISLVGMANRSRFVLWDDNGF